VAKAALLSLRRLADDAYAHEQIREAIDGLASASQRIVRKRGKAAEDKKLYANLGQAATSIRNATRALQRRKPEPTRRGRKIIAVVALWGVIALVISQRDRLKSAFAGDTSATAQDLDPSAQTPPTDGDTSDTDQDLDPSAQTPPTAGDTSATAQDLDPSAQTPPTAGPDRSTAV
jgi:hypothetical protein